MGSCFCWRGWVDCVFSLYKNGIIFRCYFLFAGATATLGSEIIARIFKTPVTSSLIPTITPFVPGGGVYYTMFYLFNGEHNLAMQKGLDTFIMTGSIILGFLVVSEIFKLYSKYKLK